MQIQSKARDLPIPVYGLGFRVEGLGLLGFRGTYCCHCPLAVGRSLVVAVAVSVVVVVTPSSS